MTVEEYIDAYTRHYSNEYLSDSKSDGLGGFISRRNFTPWLTPDHARNIAQIAREEEWKYMECQLNLRLPDTLDYNGVKVNRVDFIKDIMQQIKS